MAMTASMLVVVSVNPSSPAVRVMPYALRVKPAKPRLATTAGTLSRAQNRLTTSSSASTTQRWRYRRRLRVAWLHPVSLRIARFDGKVMGEPFSS